MYTGSLSTANTGTSSGYYQNWQPNATTGGNDTWRSSFGSVSSGYFNTGNGLYDQSTYAYWWSSSLLGSTSAYYTGLRSSSVNPGASGIVKYPGLAVRCVMDSAPQYLQEVTMEYAAQLQPGATAATKDARDGKVYRIKKMPDSKIWMMDNLAYAGGISNGGSNYFGDEHTLTFATATNTAGGSAWTTSTGITTRFVTTNNYTGSDQNSSGGQMIQNTAGTLNSGTQCQATPTTDGTNTVMTSACLSYLYNFCSAAGLDSTTTPTCAAATNTGTGTGYATAGVIGKAGGRLPQGRNNASGTNDTNNEWAILNGSMNTGTLSAANTSQGSGYYQNWQPNATTGGNDTWRSSFGTVSSGYFYPRDGLYVQSTFANWWSSSLNSSTNAYYTYVNSSFVNPGTSINNKYYGFAVRCAFP